MHIIPPAVRPVQRLPPPVLLHVEVHHRRLLHALEVVRLPLLPVAEAQRRAVRPGPPRGAARPAQPEPTEMVAAEPGKEAVRPMALHGRQHTAVLPAAFHGLTEVRGGEEELVASLPIGLAAMTCT